MKAEGAFVRSRRKWLEEGEQDAAYFFQLKRSRSKTNSIKKLNINGVINDDPKKIANHCSSFYRNLYESQYDEVAANNFLGYLTETKSIKIDQKDFCDRPITSDEVLFAIHHLKLNKSPGVDGLTSEFDISFAEQLVPFLHTI